MTHTFLAPDAAWARARARDPMVAYMRSSLGLFGLGAADSVPEPEIGEMLDATYREYAGSRCLIGSPETCVPMVESLAEIRVDEIVCLIDFGLPTEVVLDGLRSLADLRDKCEAL